MRHWVQHGFRLVLRIEIPTETKQKTEKVVINNVPFIPNMYALKLAAATI